MKRDRTLGDFFSAPSPKKSRLTPGDDTQDDASNHATYPFPVPHLPSTLAESLEFVPATEGTIINDRPDLDLLYFQPFISKEASLDLFEFLRQNLFFYRVKYTIKRGPVETLINTPRFTSVFGLDETARFSGDVIVDDKGKTLPATTYKCKPRPIPDCLNQLRFLTQNATGCQFNFALVNYYSSGNDSISYHSDDERFLGKDPAIASFTLGAKRDFLLKHKPTPSHDESETKPLKYPLGPGDMILMRGATQSNWLHSIPKRKGGEAEKGRINITYRRAMVRGGTENYYRYNVGGGEVYRWDAKRREMLPWKK